MSQLRLSYFIRLTNPLNFDYKPCRFKMNHSTNTKGTNADHALWVGDLSADVDDYGLYKCFAARYNTIQLAKGTN